MGTALAHGTNSRYVKGCRCDECTSAHRDYNRAYIDSHPGQRQNDQRRAMTAAPTAACRVVVQRVGRFEASGKIGRKVMGPRAVNAGPVAAR